MGPNFFPMQSQGYNNSANGSSERLQDLSSMPKAFVANLSNAVVWHQLKDFVTAASDAQCKFCKVLKTPDGKSRGCAILYFANEQDRDSAISQLNGATLDGRDMKVSVFEENRPRVSREFRERAPRQEIDRSKQLFVGNIPFTATEEEVFELFSQYGAMHFKLMKTKEGKSRGFGFVQFESEDQVSEALALDQSLFQGHNIAVNRSEKKEREGH